jgi:CrcB protein
VFELLVVGAGGFLGAIARYGLSGYVQRHVRGEFPAGTLAVNLVGCIVIGLFMTLVKDRQLFDPQTRMFVTMGFLGSLTTFSTFGYETVELMRGDEWRLALLNVLANVALGVIGVLIGRALGKALA